MAKLIVYGNVNPSTFANSIVVANSKSIEIFNEPLTNIFVIHSQESHKKLYRDPNCPNWIEHLANHGISHDSLINRTIDINNSNESTKKLIEYIEMIATHNTVNSHLIIDLTNGTSFQKNLLSVVAYILDIKYQFIIDITKLMERIKGTLGFHGIEDLLPSYVPVPDTTKLDDIAYLGLAEVARYKRIIELHTQRFKNINSDTADEEFFRDNLIHSIQLKLQGDKKRDNTVYRIAVSSLSASIEDLITVMICNFSLKSNSNEIYKIYKKTLGNKMKDIEKMVKQDASSDFDIEFFQKFNDFILYLRNSTTHKGKLLTDIEKFKADLSIKMSFPFIEFYTDIIHPILAKDTPTQAPKKTREIFDKDISSNEILYYGLDGDNTGEILEHLFLDSSAEQQFKQISDSISQAVCKIGEKVCTSSHGQIIFQAGDDLLFKGNFNRSTLHEMQKTYRNITNGLTCSIGYGRSLMETFLALKIAKSRHNKNSIVGIEIK
ncbi:mCpol domain-containing protein [Aulosira sp. FACHB-615]|uniref:mCpol domain-containing protein n=1 Tax=Aulosira sp. FACHB-615 TaxID=2692777 RepID=UPI001681FA97|nr:mCpol domain-containing protein [Aulosira sp. FACHB-615]MBD2489899.1 mCpol domain-containing protein [Aulosira sp. FACHB-615]